MAGSDLAILPSGPLYFWKHGPPPYAKSIFSGKVQPDCWMILVAAQMPHRTHVDWSFPSTSAARKPPQRPLGMITSPWEKL